jgi:hypothetical protein
LSPKTGLSVVAATELFSLRDQLPNFIPNALRLINCLAASGTFEFALTSL